jgi:hypothetical protein
MISTSLMTNEEVIDTAKTLLLGYAFSIRKHKGKKIL